MTSLLFNIGKTLIGWYIGSSAVASTYGAAGGLIVLLLWVYYTGQIFLFGAELATAKRRDLPALRRRIGVVFQDFRLLDHLSAFDNVALPLRLAGKRVSDFAHDVRELLSWVGLGDRMQAKPPTLSGGEQQRVAIARAVVARPDLLIADEPTGNVDPEMGARLIRLIAELNRLGTTVLIATHDRALIEATRAREMRLVEGRLVELRAPL